MSRPLKATWSDWNRTYERSVVTKEDAMMLAQEIKSKNPEPHPILELFDDATGMALGIGIGRNETVLTFQGSLDPPYYISLGDSSRSGVESFCYGCDYSEYASSSLVSWESGLLALMEFVASRARPRNIDWEQL